MRVMRVNFSVALVLVCLPLFFQPMQVEGYSACEAQIESSFYNKKYLEEALVLNQISQGNWYLIYLELNRRTPQVHQLVERYAKEENSHSPAKISAEKKEQRAKALDKALFQVLNDVMAQYQVSGGVSQNIYNHLKDRQRQRLVACFGDYFSDKPVEQQQEQAAKKKASQQSVQLEAQKKEARYFAYDLQALLEKFHAKEPLSFSGGKAITPENAKKANFAIFENYVIPKIIQSTNKK